MNFVLQFTFIAGLAVLLGIIAILMRKRAISLKYTLLWFLSIFSMLIVSIFPGIVIFISNVLGFAMASNAVFSLLIGFIILIVLSLTSIASKQTERIKTLVQTTALLEKRIRELEEKPE